ncbi:hypothetical protein ACFZDJ_29455 [Streptomyces sp. NPDC007896]|uniref:hypothetical protein n=1 Tax=Streptomyces sp. NPDC007896 TaxID=3364784 RepID=UPI0036EFF060
MADVPGRVGLVDRHDLVATLDLAARQRVTIISAPAGSGKRLCCGSGPLSRISSAESRSSRCGPTETQLFRLDLIGAIRGALNEAAEPLAASPAFDGRGR